MMQINVSKDLEKLVCVSDFAHDASLKLGQTGRDYFMTGADDEVTLKENKEAFKRWKIIPRVLRDVSKRTMSTIVLGKEVSVPLGVSPMGFLNLASEVGDIACARAAAAAGGVYTLPIFSTTSMEEIAKQVPECRRWLQIFIFSDKQLTESMIQRAEKNGFEALVLTVDCPTHGNRKKNAKRPFKLPPRLKIANFDPPVGVPEGVAPTSFADISQIYKGFDMTLTWDIIHWLQKTTKLPIILKGILSPKDAELAVKYRVAGIWVSNHGGRALDHGCATIDMLPQIYDKVGGECEIYLDGGVTKGSDVFKALALGANMVFMGRPFVWGLVTAGEEGVRNIFNIVKKELDSTMCFSGVKNIEEIKEISVTSVPVLLKSKV